MQSICYRHAQETLPIAVMCVSNEDCSPVALSVALPVIIILYSFTDCFMSAAGSMYISKKIFSAKGGDLSV
jgi:hypothetical protein